MVRSAVAATQQQKPASAVVRIDALIENGSLGQSHFSQKNRSEGLHRLSSWETDEAPRDIPDEACRATGYFAERKEEMAVLDKDPDALFRQKEMQADRRKMTASMGRLRPE